MPVKKGSTRPYFPRVKEAREALAAKAIDILEQYVEVVKAASEAGQHEVAARSLQWLMEHMPDEVGSKMIDTSVDKPKQIDAHSSPNISIGFAIGGLPGSEKKLPDVKLVKLPELEE